eukprot:TCALIF_01494-PA protein Name:"Protein of unknown function" AED:0.46 eAED:0.46 QI:0/0.25/0.6/0.8/0/0.4/5/0/91
MELFSLFNVVRFPNCTYIQNMAFPGSDTTVSQTCNFMFNRIDPRPRRVVLNSSLECQAPSRVTISKAARSSETKIILIASVKKKVEGVFKS